MTSTTTNYIPDIHGSCQWVTSDPMANFADNLPAALRITAKTAKGDVVNYYHVCPKFDERDLESVTLIKEGTMGEAEERYEIDCSFGPHFTHFSCDCQDWIRRAHRRKVCHCKHTKSVYHAFKRIGVIKE